MPTWFVFLLAGWAWGDFSLEAQKSEVSRLFDGIAVRSNSVSISVVSTPPPDTTSGPGGPSSPVPVPAGIVTSPYSGPIQVPQPHIPPTPRMGPSAEEVLAFARRLLTNGFALALLGTVLLASGGAAMAVLGGAVLAVALVVLFYPPLVNPDFRKEQGQQDQAFIFRRMKGMLRQVRREWDAVTSAFR